MIARVAGCALVAAGVLAAAYGAWPQTPAPVLLCEGYSGLPARHDGMVRLPGGVFTFGSDRFYDEEGPPHAAKVSGFWVDRHPVTNAQFARFVAVTGYLTQAERGISSETDPEKAATEADQRTLGQHDREDATGTRPKNPQDGDLSPAKIHGAVEGEQDPDPARQKHRHRHGDE